VQYRTRFLFALQMFIRRLGLENTSTVDWLSNSFYIFEIAASS